MYANTISGCQVRQQIDVGFTAMVENLVASLHSVGYADTTVSFYEQAAVHLSFWLTTRDISPSQLKENHLDGFLSRHLPRCHCPFGGVRQHKTVRAGLGHFADILRGAGYMRPAKVEAVDGVDLEVRRFDDFLLNTVGLQEATRLYRRRYVAEFLNEFFSNGDVDPCRL